jgi:hypothetical protein
VCGRADSAARSAPYLFALMLMIATIRSTSPGLRDHVLVSAA